MTVLTLVVPIWNKRGARGRGGGTFIFIFTLSFSASKRRNLVEVPQIKTKRKIMSFCFSINYVRMLWDRKG